MGNARVAQAQLIVARDGEPSARVAQAQLVVAREGEPKARIAQAQLIVCRPNVTEPEPYAADPTFKSMAKKANRQPVTLLAIESAGAAKHLYTTQAQWQAASLTRLDTTVVPGSVKNQQTMTATSATGNSAAYIHYPMALTGIWRFREVVLVFTHWQVGVYFRATMSYDGQTITSDNYYAPMGGGIQKWQGGFWYTPALGFVADMATHVFLFRETLEVTAGETATFGFRAYSSATGEEWTGGEWQYNWTEPPQITVVPQTSALVSASIDTGSIPSAAYIFGADDILGAGSTLLYGIEGRNLETDSWTDLGAIADGEEADLYRYYRLSADFTATGPRSSEIRELMLSEGNFVYFSTHDHEPVAARPLVKKVSSLSTKIQFGKGFPTTGEVTPELHWTKAAGDLIASGTLKNNAARIKLGFVGLALPEYQDFHTGTFYDWSASFKSRSISVKIRDVLKTFEKVKIPFETTDEGGNKTTVPIIWTDANPVQVLLEIFDAMGLASRYIPYENYIYLRDGVFFGPEWKVSRTLAEPTAVSELMSELSSITGLFLVPTPDGKITPVLYDPEGTPVATFDATVQDFDDIEGNQKDLFTRQAVYYNANTADPSEEEDYDSAYLLIDAAAEIARGGEVSIKTYFDKWGISSAAALAIANRWATWYVDPLISVKVRNVSAYYIDILPGQVVAVDNLEIPVTAAYYGGKTSGKKFLVTSRTLDPAKALMSFDLRAIDELTTVALPEAVEAPAVLTLSGTEEPIVGTQYVATGGCLPLTWEISAGAISSTGQVTSLSGCCGSGTVTVTDACGAQSYLSVRFPIGVWDYGPFSWTGCGPQSVGGAVMTATAPGHPRTENYWNSCSTSGGGCSGVTCEGCATTPMLLFGSWRCVSLRGSRSSVWSCP